MTGASASRVLGRIRGAEPGPTLLVVAAIHGNEPAGVEAARRVLDAVGKGGTDLRGELACIVGNVGALAKGVRQRSRDLNRAWDAARVAALNAGAPFADPEDEELLALDRAIATVVADARGPAHVLDLHTTSGDGPPFTIAVDASGALARSVPLTCITGLLELLDGTMLLALARRGLGGLVVESGRHDDPASVDRAEAAIRVSLAAAGLVGDGGAPLLHATEVLTAARGGLPCALNVFHRHAIRPGDGFRMRPGYRHFQRVTRGEVLAADVRGEVPATEDAYILMPLYQGTGSDGFFLAR